MMAAAPELQQRLAAGQEQYIIIRERLYFDFKLILSSYLLHTVEISSTTREG